MSSIVTAAGIMGGLGLLFGGILALAYRFLRVEEDPRLQVLEGMLPGTNCGACGKPGCRGFAEALLAMDIAPSACSVSSREGVQAIAGFLGVEAGEAVRRVARLHCAGGRAEARQSAAYQGEPSCRAASLVAAGGRDCVFGCLGLADCEVACTFGAIRMNVDGLPVVDIDRCTACGDCVDACPRDLFEILPLSQSLLVQCRAPLAGDAARALCRVACDACGRCVQDAPEGALEMRNELPVVDPVGASACGPEVTFRCPTGAIAWVTGRQFEGVALVEERR